MWCGLLLQFLQKVVPGGQTLFNRTDNYIIQRWDVWKPYYLPHASLVSRMQSDTYGPRCKTLFTGLELSLQDYLGMTNFGLRPSLSHVDNPKLRL